MSSVGALLQSTMTKDRWTWAPVQVLMLARLIGDRIRDHLRVGRPVASLQPCASATLRMALKNEAGRAGILHVKIGKAYDSDPKKYVVGAEALGVLRVPDAPEALHLAGIILDDVRAKSARLGWGVPERNPLVVGGPVMLRAVSGSVKVLEGCLERCYRRIDLPRCVYAPHESVMAVLSHDHTETPVEMFNWAARVVKRVRRNLKIRKIRASLWGYRGRRFVARPVYGTSEVVNENYFNHPYVAATLEDASGKRMTLRFYQSNKHNLADVLTEVPDFMQALHMISMVLDTLGVHIIDIGCRDMESNPHVLARPLEPGQSYGRMVAASNFVELLKPELQ